MHTYTNIYNNILIYSGLFEVSLDYLEDILRKSSELLLSKGGRKMNIEGDRDAISHLCHVKYSLIEYNLLTRFFETLQQ